ncbi:MAG: FAD-dependent oxidoreductase [Actinomycetota bacterium]|nr:FAD-dependent oxidoreductase [Actinomycetota bacterium]
MNRYELVIGGGGLAAARAIKSYREAGGQGSITLVTEEATLPYHRPALSKKYLRGEKTETPHVEEDAFYREHDIDVLLERRVVAVDPVEQIVALDRGGRIRYGKLLLATGAAPRRLRVPGGDLAGVFNLRTVGDSAAIREAAGASERAVVVGGGFIGMETAASLRQLGLEVTLIHLGAGLFDQLGSAELSEQLAALYREHGVELLLEHEVARFGGDGALAHVETTNGRRVAADLGVVGVGVAPNVDFLAGSGISLEDGIAVNERFETNAPGVYAVGDVASFFDPLYRRRRRIEHWSNANYQGSEIGKILAGGDGGYDSVSSFFSEVFGTTVKVFGDVSRFDTATTEGCLAEGFLATYGNAGRLVGAVTVGHSEELETLVKELIAERAPADALEHEVVGGRS